MHCVKINTLLMLFGSDYSAECEGETTQQIFMIWSQVAKTTLLGGLSWVPETS